MLMLYIKNKKSLQIMFYRDFLFCNSFQRRDRDSNPGYLAVQRFSRPPQSTTLPPLQNSSFKKCFSLKAMQNYYSFLISQIFRHKNIISTIFYKRNLFYGESILEMLHIYIVK